jgi:uncharacterized membrane protein (UPF0127 family)
MTRVTIVSIAMLVCVALTAVVAHARSQAPPARAIVESTPIRGVSDAQAVVYRHNGVRLGAVIASNGTQDLVWSRRLAGTPARLFSPGPKGLLVGVVRFPGSQKAQVFAYIVRATGVVSAIPGHPSGEITADEGANFHGMNFAVKDVDSGHVGSVKYRLETTYSWALSKYSQTKRVRVPDYATSVYPTPNAIVTTKAGNIALIKLEIADTEAERNTGLMNRTSLDLDSGMIFVWPSPVLESFWMENTYIPLSVAFLGPDGKVQQIMDMDPLTTALHTPSASYQYAIEANLGYFKAAGIEPGDTFDLHLTS